MCKHNWNYTRFGSTEVRICKNCSKMETKDGAFWVEKTLQDFVKPETKNEDQMR